MDNSSEKDRPRTGMDSFLPMTSLSIKLVHYQLSGLYFCVHVMQAKVPWVEEPQLRKCLYQITCWLVCGIFLIDN